jgi:hypothetical protein
MIMRLYSMELNMTAKEAAHLQWIYDRLVNVHGENVHLDYMIQFQQLIARHIGGFGTRTGRTSYAAGCFKPPDQIPQVIEPWPQPAVGIWNKAKKRMDVLPVVELQESLDKVIPDLVKTNPLDYLKRPCITCEGEGIMCYTKGVMAPCRDCEGHGFV